ncbi:Ncw2p KNAG_0B02560 [Huiozyma naganishii CBS 8797]|uniref:Uncharacterized protein n=1 Tax=Huiozyma naganishii (strain ATCC MYA-139 / BCRC 22969 / CBS 8797 / KCTC 17520 / NBRC 10181 / NCYC 3082 / Yp74L-3) TaxID=1071383 RepID=J7RGM9_HUIN7|nr:hypothetical protein KNAG_0B02560 [Kazachstania naganishii CBS 8797]CCK68698.1 hypothetical protein KNAG_0B02560 [Kazachstania naganishii CBS 8797]
MKSSIVLTSLLSTLAIATDTGALEENPAATTIQQLLQDTETVATNTAEQNGKVDTTAVAAAITAAATVATTDAATNTYAVAPSGTIVTTDAQGRTTTQLVWYNPANVASGKTDAATATAKDTTKVSDKKGTLQSTETAKVKTGSVASETHTTTDGPLSTVVGTNSLGQTYTSTLWWLPSTVTTATSGSSHSSGSSSGSSKKRSSTATIAKNRNGTTSDNNGVLLHANGVYGMGALLAIFLF